MSPTRSPGQPASTGSFCARRSKNAISTRCPQARLRDGRITCQFGPSAGRDTAPLRHPRSTAPIACGGPAVGATSRPNKTFAASGGDCAITAARRAASCAAVSCAEAPAQPTQAARRRTQRQAWRILCCRCLREVEGHLRLPHSKIEVGVVFWRGDTRDVIGEDRAEARARLDPRVPFLGGFVCIPGNVAEIIEARQVRGGGDV